MLFPVKGTRSMTMTRFRKRRIIFVSVIIVLCCKSCRRLVTLEEKSFYLQEAQTPSIVAKSSVKILPDWRMTTDCSVYSMDCVVRKLNEHRYAEYPFQFAEKYNERYKWQARLPENWQDNLKDSVPRSGRNEQAKHHGPAIERCLREAQAKSVEEQLDQLLGTLRRENNMVSFTISDFSYAHDMIQEVFEMAYNVVGFNNAFFMVAMDVPTMELACQFHYPFLAWPQEKTEGLKSIVANAKFDISYELVKRGQSFFFFEMDVWFLKSPMPVLREQDVDILFSGHQYNPQAANIGVYSVIANERSEEYLRICIEVLQESPDTHDQLIMRQVAYFLDDAKDRQPSEYVELFQTRPIKIPKFEHRATHGRFVPYQIATDERPVVTASTLAIHTLCGAPLRNPHGKKQIAKELGAWYGSGNYYRGGEDIRYLWIDGHEWNGISMTISWPGFHPLTGFHKFEYLQWLVAATIALARRTGRIWVMPKVLSANGVHFIWTVLDMESVETLVEVRETNFPVNSKAWHSPTVPFESVARTALGYQGKIFAQASATETGSTDTLAWNSTSYSNGTSPFDAWFAIHTAIPELVEAQVLLAGLPAFHDIIFTLQDKVRSIKTLGIAESEILHTWKTLKWCDISLGPEMIVGRAAAESDCYSKGKPVEFPS